MSNSQFVNKSSGFSSSVASVLFSQSTHERLEQTKSGAYVYKGDASSFHEWEARTRLRVSGVTEEKYAEAVSKITEGLRGDMSLWPRRRQDHWSRQSNHFHEGKELFKQCTKPGGCLSRQQGEAMHQFVARRTRSWKMLNERDSEIKLGDAHRADLLLEFAGINKNERIMIQASLGNVRESR